MEGLSTRMELYQYSHIPSLRIPAHQVRIFLAVVELEEWKDFQLDWRSNNFSNIPFLRIPAYQGRIFLALMELQVWKDFQLDWSSTNYSHCPSLRIPAHQHIRLEYF
jgi:hypothetical protein